MKKLAISIILLSIAIVSLPYTVKADTVVFFDNFETGVLDSAKWIDVNQTKGEESISNSTVYEGTGSLRLYGSDLGGTNGPAELSTVGSLNLTSAVIDFYYYIDAGLDNQGTSRLRLNDAKGNYIVNILLFSQNHILTPPDIDPIYYQIEKSGPEIVLTPEYYINLNKWNHITISYTGSNVAININDNEYTNTMPSNPNAGPLDSINISAGKQYNDYAKAYFDKFIIYNGTCFTQTDIQASYDKGYDAGIDYCKNNPSACGISTGGSTPCPPSGSTILNNDLSFSIPSAVYQSPFGNMDLEVDFTFFGEQSGKLLWKLESYKVK